MEKLEQFYEAIKKEMTATLATAADKSVTMRVVSPFFAEAAAEFLGAAMLPENKELRDAYCEKFPGAFDEGVALAGETPNSYCSSQPASQAGPLKTTFPWRMGFQTSPLKCISRGDNSSPFLCRHEAGRA